VKGACRRIAFLSLILEDGQARRRGSPGFHFFLRCASERVLARVVNALLHWGQIIFSASERRLLNAFSSAKNATWWWALSNLTHGRAKNRISTHLLTILASQGYTFHNLCGGLVDLDFQPFFPARLCSGTVWVAAAPFFIC
jgi:hypothetical protein